MYGFLNKQNTVKHAVTNITLKKTMKYRPTAGNNFAVCTCQR